MAAVALTVGQAHGFTAPNGSEKETTGNKNILCCFVPITAVAGTYASADNANAAAVGAAIAATRRDGRTITLLSAAFAAPGKLAAGTVIGAKTVAVSTDALTMELTQGDLSTEVADGALTDTFAEPIQLFVCFKH